MTSIGTPYRRFEPAGSYDAIVIGSGIGGLAAAALLAKHARKRVLVLEQHYTAGGFTHTFHRNGFEWDVGVHYIGDVGHPKAPMRVVLDDIAAEPIEWASMGEVYDRIVLGDEVYDFAAGRENFVERLAARFPGERAAIERYLDRVAEAQRAGMLYFAERAIPAPAAALVGGLMRRKLERLAARTTREVLEEITSNQKLISVLTGQFGDYGLPPARSSFAIHAMVAGHYLRGGFFPVGGASRFAAAIVPTIEQRGGAVVVRAVVERILVEGGRAAGVRLEDGRELRAPVIVSDAGAHNTFGRLLGAEVPAREREAIAGLTRSVGHMCLYLGLDRTAEELELPKANLWLYPDEHHERNVDAFVADPEAPFPVVYVSFPAAKDPSFTQRHPGRSTIDVITLAPYAWFERWRDSRWHHRGDEYEALKQRFTERLLTQLYRWVPQAEGHVIHGELSTPLTTQHFAAWERGELYGLDHDPRRFQERRLRPRTSVPGLYLTGQDVCSAGVGGALMGGVLCASALTNKNMLSVAQRALGR
ncbi:MAG: NAD(P)/FAD-dependent oxidoreductase [bacterium]